MTVQEILVRKRYLDSKLATINKYINTISSSSLDNAGKLLTAVITYKFDLLSKLRSHSIMLDKLNRDTYIIVDNIELSIYEALHLLDTLELKLETFRNLIESSAVLSIDMFDVLNKNDILFEEYQRIYQAIQLSDITTKWEKE